MRKKTQTCTVELLSSGQSWGRGMWLCLGPDRDRFISVLSDNATIKQASRLQHSGVFINSFFFRSFFGGTGTRRVRALRSSKNASIFEPTERRKYLLIRQINRLLPRWVVRLSKTEWLMGPCIWVVLRPFIKESNILTKCTVESVTGRFFYLVPGRELKR